MPTGPQTWLTRCGWPGTVSARGLGTVVVMRGQILSARHVRKRHATNLDAFDAPEPERLGMVKRGRVHMRMRIGRCF